jgi:hypothetical protein
MTSPEALAALRRLPEVNPELHKSFLRGRSEATGDEPDPDPEKNDLDDDSCVPVPVVIDHIVSEGTVQTPGFGVDEDGNLVRTGEAEAILDAEAIVDECGNNGDKAGPAVFGRGHRKKATSTRYKNEWMDSDQLARSDEESKGKRRKREAGKKIPI